MKILLICITVLLTITGMNGQVLNIEIEGKTYTVRGDNLTIIIGKKPIINVSKEVPAHLRDSIRNKFEGKINIVRKQYNNGKITLNELEKQQKQCQIEFETANAIAEKLSEAFSRIDFSKQSYLYRLAYVLYDEGNIEAAQAVLSSERLEQNEACQSVQYLLSAAALWAGGKKEQAIIRLEMAIKKYPSFITWCSYGDYLFANGEFEQAAKAYQEASELSTNHADTQYALIQAAYCFFHAEMSSNAVLSFKKASILPNILDNIVPDTLQGCHLAPPLLSLPVDYMLTLYHVLGGYIEYAQHPDSTLNHIDQALSIIQSYRQKGMLMPLYNGVEHLQEWYMLEIQCYIVQKDKIKAQSSWDTLQIYLKQQDSEINTALIKRIKTAIEDL
jgi:tetratricopeptide (TPR) repeat protein